jgi:hypothetical protein
MSDSEVDSLDMNQNDTQEILEEPEDQLLSQVREAIRQWKAKELEKNSDPNGTAKGLQALRSYVARSGKMYYDLVTYLTSETETEENRRDAFYKAIVSAIGDPKQLSNHGRSLIEYTLERDLIEFPFTVEPRSINTYANKGLTTETEFPDAE